MNSELTHTRAPWQPPFVAAATFLLLMPQTARADVLCGVSSAQQVVPAEFPQTISFGDAGRPETISDTEQQAAFQHAIIEWNNVTCSFAELETGSDGAVQIFWADPTETSCIQERQLGFTLITPCENFPARSVLLNGGDAFEWRTEPDPYQGDATPLIVDLRSVLTHEIGHALGLPHVDDSLATMAALYLRDGGQASLAAADKLALCELYPTPNDECVSDRDCEGECVGDAGSRVCEEFRGELGAYCALDDRICEVCLLSSPDTFSGYCSEPCDDSCPDPFECRDGFCEIEEVPESSGCATARNRPVELLPLAILLWAGRRRITPRSHPRREPCRTERW